MRLAWRDVAPIEFNSNLGLVSFRLTDVLIQEYCLGIFSTGNFSCVK